MQKPKKYVLCVAIDLIPSIASPFSVGIGQIEEGLDRARVANVSASVGLGRSLFFGEAASFRPIHLKPMPSFSGDLLDESQAHGDALVHLEGDDTSDLARAASELLLSMPAWRERWRIDGFRKKNEDRDGKWLTRNLFHFVEGFGNPDTVRELFDRSAVSPGSGEPAWANGGSYQVIRIVRFSTDFWDRDPAHEQERIMGRRRDGRWLDGTPSAEQPNFAADPHGRATPLDSHVRLAVPDRRNPPPMVRRSYSYDRGDGDSGLIFSCFQRDLIQGFETVQRRLEGERLAKYILTIGGGYFFVPPPGNGWIESLSHT
ncbi:Dyp-type peroxidase [Streptomyces sp. CS7]|uniref:Dyp-type peroxidase n=1 Tax=Streptomyces sp. CS-7 TaxID=2906769 RepID=UPI0021B23730|nr:Dyp-type peroxidase [Streptomyces sp. CS-7]MCT6781488.1 Dyp-type peroxidase [Streptomyces sp. CS-7]